VAHNRAVVRAFEDVLKTSVVIPQHHTPDGRLGHGIGSIGRSRRNGGTPFAGFAPLEAAATTRPVFRVVNCRRFRRGETRAGERGRGGAEGQRRNAVDLPQPITHHPQPVYLALTSAPSAPTLSD
jgi:hypothetical protein